RSDYYLAGGYFELFPLYGEELVLSLGFFGLGKEIHYYPHVPIIHEQVMTGRDEDPGKRYHLAEIIMAPGAMVLRAPVPDVFLWYPTLLLRSAAKVFFVERRPFVAIHGLVDAMLWLPTFLKQRHAISRPQFRRWLQTRFECRREARERVGERAVEREVCSKN